MSTENKGDNQGLPATNDVSNLPITLNQAVGSYHTNFNSLHDFRLACQGFNTKVNKEPEEASLGQTPDKKAQHIFISHVEMTLDEYFFGLWSTENFRWAVIANEIVGSIDLVVIHPVTGFRMVRTGAAAIQIMVDKVPDEIYKDPVKRNQWALNIENKKPAALDMGFPKLKAECIKNAAKSIGKLFGRDLNREEGNVDTLQPLVKAKVEVPEELKVVISEADLDAIGNLWTANPQYHSNPEFLTLLNTRKEELKAAK